MGKMPRKTPNEIFDEFKLINERTCIRRAKRESEWGRSPKHSKGEEL